MTAVRGLFVLCVFAAACTTPSARTCPFGLSPAAEATLYFGRSIPGGGQVSDADWDAFLADVVAPRFPDGFTVLHGEGRYRGGDGVIVEEPSKLLVVVTPDPAAARPLIEEIRAAYRERFRQESVLLVEESACFGL